MFIVIVSCTVAYDIYIYIYVTDNVLLRALYRMTGQSVKYMLIIHIAQFTWAFYTMFEIYHCP